MLPAIYGAKPPLTIILAKRNGVEESVTIGGYTPVNSDLPGGCRLRQR